MRKNWTRSEEELKLTNVELEALIAPAFPRSKVINCQLASGGLANTNIRVMLIDRKEPVLVRIFTRDPDQAEKEFRINNAISSTVPSPEFFHFSSDNAVTGHPYVVMEWVNAPRFELVLNKLSQNELLDLANSLGRVLAEIHRYKFPTFGFLDNRLKVSTPLNMSGEGMRNFAKECLFEKGGDTHLGSELSSQVMDFLDYNAALLDTWTGAPCLVHSDFGPSNLLVHDKGNGWEVAAVLDWEFAFSGTPFFDFGNLLRPPIGTYEDFAPSVVKSYEAAGGRISDDWQKLSRLTDLSAWFDFLSRPTVPVSLATDAQQVIADTISYFEA